MISFAVIQNNFCAFHLSFHENPVLNKFKGEIIISYEKEDEGRVVCAGPTGRKPKDMLNKASHNFWTGSQTMPNLSEWPKLEVCRRCRRKQRRSPTSKTQNQASNNCYRSAPPMQVTRTFMFWVKVSINNFRNFNTRLARGSSLWGSLIKK